MVDVPDEGLRPLVEGPDAEAAATRALAVCPGHELQHDPAPPPGVIDELLTHWGPVVAVWEGHAADEEVRWAGSSGGAGTALALHALEMGLAPGGVAHIAADPDDPIRNRTVFSHSRAELLAATGSRYAPASPCDRLNEIRDGAGPVVLIGKPCDVAGARKAAAVDADLAANLPLLIGIFCAGTPSSDGSVELLGAMGVGPADAVRSLRYRGNGWPGSAVAEVDRSGAPVRMDMSYNESWGTILQRHCPWRCRVCADHTGEFADIAVGDPWYRDVGEGASGSSLIIARTEAGMAFLEQAVAAGALTAAPVDPVLLERSQPNLLRTRGSVWGRITMSRAMGVPAPRYRHMPTFPAWRDALTTKQQAQSFYGTVKRILTRKLYRRKPFNRLR